VDFKKRVLLDGKLLEKYWGKQFFTIREKLLVIDERNAPCAPAFFQKISQKAKKTAEPIDSATTSNIIFIF